ncbi:MAG: heavy-metal-associated domain-containing protein [Desulfuromusa sp.]|nr:heavy-metal-associated domain-containing protein [Desulfuromusa sp.]
MNINLPVFGMKCQKCVAKVTGIIEAFLQVAEVLVSLDAVEATIQPVSESPVTVAMISAALLAAGFDPAFNHQGDPCW